MDISGNSSTRKESDEKSDVSSNQTVITLNISCNSEKTNGNKGIHYYLNFAKPSQISPADTLIYWKAIKRKDKTPLLDAEYQIVDTKYLGDSIFLFLVGRVNFIGQWIMYLYNARDNLPLEILKISPNQKYHLIGRELIIRENQNDGSLEVMKADSDKEEFFELANGLEIMAGTKPLMLDENKMLFIPKQMKALIYVDLSNPKVNNFSDSFEFLDLQTPGKVITMTNIGKLLYLLDTSGLLMVADLKIRAVVRKKQTKNCIEGITDQGLSSYQNSIVLAYQQNGTSHLTLFSADLNTRADYEGPKDERISEFGFFDWNDALLVATRHQSSPNVLHVKVLKQGSEIFEHLASVTMPGDVERLQVTSYGLVAFTRREMLRVLVSQKVVFTWRD